jgi:hypothetical protein
MVHLVLEVLYASKLAKRKPSKRGPEGARQTSEGILCLQKNPPLTLMMMGPCDSC